MASKKNTKKKTTTKKKVAAKKEVVEKEIEVEEVEDIKEEKEVVKPKKSSKQSKGKGWLIAIVCVVAFFIISIILPSNGEKEESRTVKDWADDVKTKTVVTVIGSTTCPHCQDYKPVIKKLAKENDFLLYFFEMEELSEDEKNVVLGTFELENFDGGVPFTFIVKDGKVVSDTTGYSTEDSVIKFLKTNEIIK